MTANMPPARPNESVMTNCLRQGSLTHTPSAAAHRNLAASNLRERIVSLDRLKEDGKGTAPDNNYDPDTANTVPAKPGSRATSKKGKE